MAASTAVPLKVWSTFLMRVKKVLLEKLEAKFEIEFRIQKFMFSFDIKLNFLFSSFYDFQGQIGPFIVNRK